jgi:hypothetical protein
MSTPDLRRTPIEKRNGRPGIRLRRRPGQKIAVRVISQFGEETTKILEAK